MRGNTEYKELMRARALNNNTVNRFTAELPTGEGWYSLQLRFNHTVVIGTGTGALSQGLLRSIKRITLRSDKGEFFCNGVPGRPLYFFDLIKSGTAALLDANTAANGTYRTFINVWFADPLAAFAEDFIINSGRYQSMTLEVQVGGVADLYGTVGTSTDAVTLEVMLERQRGPVPEKIQPKWYKEYGIRVPADPSVVSEILLERASNLSFLRFLVFASNTATAGDAASGNLGDAILNDVTVDHDGGRPFETALFNVLQQQNKQAYGLEAAQTGVAAIDFARDGSLQSALYSGDKSRLSLKWTNGTLGSVPQVTLAYEAWRPLAP